MRVAVVTTFSPDGWNQYGGRMVSSFLKMWPKEVDLHVYLDDFTGVTLPKDDRLKVHRHDHPVMMNFKKEHKSLKWRGHHQAQGTYNYRFDVVKFCHKPFAIWDFMMTHPKDYDWVIWLDADTITHTRVTMETVQRMIPDGDFHYLGRPWKYSEAGWMVFHMQRGYPILQGVIDLYQTRKYRMQKEWHDSYLFDVIRERLETEGTLKTVNLSKHLTREKGGGHPFINTWLGDYMDHHKGPRKVAGQPRTGDLQRYSDNPHWSTQKHVVRKKASRANDPN